MKFILARLSFPISLICLCLLTYSSFAQKETVKASAFFEVDERVVFNANDIDRAYSIIPKNSSARVIGYADYAGDEAYNISLSEDRAQAVVDFLMERSDGRVNIISMEGMGELPQGNTTDADAKARRVDIIFEFEKVEKVSKEKPSKVIPPPPAPPKASGVSEESFEIDTIVKENIVLKGLSFIGGRHFPTRESMPELYKLVETMKKYPKLEIEIQGHICCDYSQPDGIDNDTGEPILSKNRAQYVYEFLSRNGIDESRMTYVGLGSTQPKVFPEVSEEDQQTNRRVEIKIVNL